MTAIPLIVVAKVLEQLFGVEEDGDRALVHQFDFHYLLEASGFAAQAEGAYLGDEVFVEFAGALGTGGGVERRPFPFPDVPKQGELRDGEYRPAYVRDAAVHFPVFIFKDAQAGDFRSEIIGVGFGVFVRDSQQNE